MLEDVLCQYLSNAVVAGDPEVQDLSNSSSHVSIVGRTVKNR